MRAVDGGGVTITGEEVLRRYSREELSVRVSSLIAAALIAFLPALTYAKTYKPASDQHIRQTLAVYARAHPQVLFALGTISGEKSRTYFVRAMNARIPFAQRASSRCPPARTSPEL